MLPSATAYLFYLVYLFASGTEKMPFIMLVVLCVTYGVQIAIFSIKREFSFLAWMVIYVLAMPIWNIILPLYSFWRMDDFSWGKTREIAKGPQNESIPVEGISKSVSVFEFKSETNLNQNKNLDSNSIPLVAMGKSASLKSPGSKQRAELQKEDRIQVVVDPLSPDKSEGFPMISPNLAARHGSAIGKIKWHQVYHWSDFIQNLETTYRNRSEGKHRLIVNLFKESIMAL
jgi:hypothetical protein